MSKACEQRDCKINAKGVCVSDSIRPFCEWDRAEPARQIKAIRKVLSRNLTRANKIQQIIDILANAAHDGRPGETS